MLDVCETINTPFVSRAESFPSDEGSEAGDEEDDEEDDEELQFPITHRGR